MGAFLVAAAPLLLLETSSRENWPALLAAAAVGVVAFVVLVARHRRLSRASGEAQLGERVRRESLARMERRWDDFEPLDLAPAHEDHAYAADLDVLGRASLAHLLGRPRTAPGQAALRHVLLFPLHRLPTDPRVLMDGAERPGAPPENPSASRSDGSPAPAVEWAEELQARQAAVERLSREPDLLDELQIAARQVSGQGSSQRTAAFLRWATGEAWLAGRAWLIWAARAVAVFNVGTLVAWLAGWITPPVWLLGMGGAHLLHRHAAKEAHARFAAAEGGEGDPLRWGRLLDRALRLPEGTPIMDRIRDVAGTPPPGASGALRHLRRLTDVAAVRHSSLAHFPLVTLFAWDLHVLHPLEAWQRRYGPSAAAWVRAVGELELLVALAVLKHEHPHWAFPSIRNSAEKPSGDGASTPPPAAVLAEDLGHPLLPPSTCVGNDVQLPEPGRLLLVTGSNMAGKTTLLRALGTNQVLALAGGPVAAASLQTLPILPWTAMRVRDSVTGGVSYFMAELHRLRRVVEAAQREPVLYLLDEILQGTNTAERRTAARIVLRHLLETRAVGAVTTHDLTLADAPDLQARSVDVHFREDVVRVDGRRRLHFDYQLRPGPATSRNALLLLEMVGLGEDPGRPPPAED